MNIDQDPSEKKNGDGKLIDLDLERALRAIEKTRGTKVAREVAEMVARELRAWEATLTGDQKADADRLDEMLRRLRGARRKK